MSENKSSQIHFLSSREILAINFCFKEHSAGLNLDMLVISSN